MEKILAEFYNINSEKITEVQGGFAARAFKIECKDKKFFLKRYDKSRPITEKYTTLIDVYCPIVEFLSKTTMTNCLPKLVLTATGENFCQDSNYKYMVYEYIDGITIADSEYTKSQISHLGKILALLHGCKYSEEKIPKSIYEDFSVDFNDNLKAFIYSDISEFEFLNPYVSKIKELINAVDELSKNAKNCKAPFVLCHTDIHRWNLMQTQENLILIDWEGLKFAPKEADFFALENLPYRNEFIKQYEKYNGKYVPNKTIMNFYIFRRKSEDIWEYIEKLLFENLTAQEIQDTINSTIEECLDMPNIML